MAMYSLPFAVARRPPRRLPLIVLGVLTILSACAGNQGIVYNRNFTSAYSPNSLSAMRQPLPVETFGTPGPAAAQERVTAATIQGLRDHGPRWTRFTFTGNPKDVPNAPYHLRVVFGAATGFARNSLCREDFSQGAIALDPDSDRTIVAVCRNGRYISTAEGSPGPVVDITSEGFARFVGLIGRQVLPRRNPEANLPRRDD